MIPFPSLPIPPEPGVAKPLGGPRVLGAAGGTDGRQPIITAEGYTPAPVTYGFWTWLAQPHPESQLTGLGRSPETGESRAPSPYGVSVDLSGVGGAGINNFRLELYAGWKTLDLYRLPPIPGLSQDRVLVLGGRTKLGFARAGEGESGVKNFGLVQKTLEVLSLDEARLRFGDSAVSAVEVLGLGAPVTRAGLLANNEVLLADLLFPASIGNLPESKYRGLSEPLGLGKSGSLPGTIGVDIPPAPLPGPAHDC